MPDKRKDHGTSGGSDTLSESPPTNKVSKRGVLESNGRPAKPSSGVMAFDPVHFIRSHSKHSDATDIQTQVWDASFEPDLDDPSKTSARVATCGGNAICIIDVNSGTVLMKYTHKDIKEKYYTLAWSTIDMGEDINIGSGTRRSNILASGGTKGEIRLFHPQRKVCFHDWRPGTKKNVVINSLIFHTENPKWLFCGTSDSVVTIWDIGQPSLPEYFGVNCQQLIRLFPDYGEIYNLVWTGSNNWLLAGTAAGLIGWNINEESIKNNKTSNKTPQMVDFIMPESPLDKGEHPIVDSIAVLTSWHIVSKCALHGFIYLWDLKSTVKGITRPESSSEETKIVEKDVKMLARLKWSDTDNFYMNLGCHKGRGLLACGDEKGCLWLYNLDQFSLEGAHVPPPPPLSIVMQPTNRLTWPKLRDDDIENSRKISTNRHDEIIIDKVTVSEDGQFLVGVTSNNMVCIWKRMADRSSLDE